jgi:gamma-glutamyl phosphate reductase
MPTQLPTTEQADQAYAYMLDKIHVPAFLEKLAANGIQPRSDAEAQQLLQLGAVLAQKEVETAEKTAQDGNSFLTHVLAKHGVQAGATTVADIDSYVKQGADAIIANDDIALNAALIYQHTVTGGKLATEE